MVKIMKRTDQEWKEFFNDKAKNLFGNTDVDATELANFATAVQQEQLNQIINWLETWGDDPMYGVVALKLARTMQWKFKL